MLKFCYEGEASIPDGLAGYINAQKKSPEEFINLPSDGSYLKQVKDLAKKYQLFESVVVVGIGGSSLGTMAVWQALGGHKKVFFAETLDPRHLDRITSELKRPALVVVVSKSGTTTETVGNFAVLRTHLSNEDKIVAITDEGSKLWNWAEKNNIDKLPIPKNIGGRYSVFSAVGLFPLAIAGVDVDNLLKGAEKITAECLSDNPADNPAALSALVIYENLQAGKTIHDTFLFAQDLEYVGKWYRQLTGESIGKEGKGITPTVSIGTTDLHSVAQLYLGGPKDKFTTFVSAKDYGKDFTIPDGDIDDLVSGISGKKFSEIMSAVLKGVKVAYKKQGLPYVEIELDKIDAESIGALFQMKMIEMAYLGKLLGVNAFDQPQVELYKEEVRNILK